MKKIGLYLELGRVSNLPTVVSNILAAAALTGVAYSSEQFLLLAVFAILVYVAGMYLNDAYDLAFDRKFNPHRPIPSGRITVRRVTFLGYAMMAAALIAYYALVFQQQQPISLYQGLAPLALISMVIFYDLHHKANPLAPLLMGLCRVLLYIAVFAALAAKFDYSLFVGKAAIASLLLLSYLIGLSYTAKFESGAEISNKALKKPLAYLFLFMPMLVLPFMGVKALPFVLFCGWVLSCVVAIKQGRIPLSKVVPQLIAGIALLDACIVTTVSTNANAAGYHGVGMTAAIACFALTMLLQTKIKGT